MKLVAQLGTMVRGFHADPGRYGPAISQLRSQHPQDFLDASAGVLGNAPDSSGTAYLLTTLDASDQLIPLLLKLAETQSAALPLVMKSAMRVQSGLNLELIRRIDLEMEESDLLLYLQLLESSPDGLKIVPVLRKLMTCKHPKVQSKVALLMGRVVVSEDWFASRMKDSDARVRANAIEALWRIDLPRRQAVFELATTDANARVAANGWIGLHRCGDIRSLKGLETMASSEDLGIRRSAAWAMGRTRDQRFIPFLERLEQDPAATVQSNARKARASIERATPRHAADGRLIVFRAADRQIDFAVFGPGDAALTNLKALDVRADINAKPVLDYSLDAVVAPSALVCAVVYPQLPQESELEQALRYVVEQKRPADDWNAIAYSPEADNSPETHRSDSIGSALHVREVHSTGMSKDSLLDSIMSAIRALAGARKARHLAVVLAGSMNFELPRAQMELIESEASRGEIAVHLISTGPVEPAWETLSLRRDGLILHDADPARDWHCLQNLANAIVHRWRLKLPPSESLADEVSLSIASGQVHAQAAVRFQ